MRKKFLNHINILLGALSLGLAGCHSSKQQVVLYGPPPMEEKYGIPEVVALYGVVEPTPEEDADTTFMEVRPQEPPILCKYGVPAPLKDK